MHEFGHVKSRATMLDTGDQNATEDEFRVTNNSFYFEQFLDIVDDRIYR